MIVVAIIGVLATIATPNFMHFAAKARQTEAKGQLSALYAAEKTWFAEWSTYTFCLYQAGYEPEPNTRRFYNSGFRDGAINNPGAVKDFATGQDCNFGIIAWGGTRRNDGIFEANAVSNPAANGAALPVYTITAGGFTAGAWGSISTLPIVDAWTITDGKVMTNVQRGY